MRKINITLVIFIFLSLIWLSFFSLQLFQYLKISGKLAFISNNLKDIDNLNYYKRNVENLELEFESISTQSFSSKSTSEFIAKLPKIGEFSGIDRMKIENAEVKKENGLEVTELKINTASMFPSVADFIDILERSKLPIRISALSMNYENGRLDTVMTIKIYKKMIGD